MSCLKFFLTAFSVLFINLNSNAQIICIQCFEQTNAISPSASNLILNGSFENTTCIQPTIFWCPVSTLYNCDIDHWICTGGGTSTYACMYTSSNSIIADGIYAPYFGNLYMDACPTPNDSSCLSAHGCEMTGILPGYPINLPDFGGTAGVSLEQSVSGLIAGNIYFLEFWVGGEDDSIVNNGLFGVDIGFGYNYLRDPSTGPMSVSNGIRYLIEFKATSGTHKFKFTNWGHMSPLSTELVLDDVRLYPKAALNTAYQPCDQDTINNVVIDTTICNGDHITVNGINYSVAGTFHDSVIYSEWRKDYVTIHLHMVQCNFETIRDTLICIDDSILFHGNYLSASGTYIDSTVISPYHTDISILHLNVEPCFNIYIPSAFSPNNDHLNDIFNVSSNNFHPIQYNMRIYNRWGQKLFNTTDIKKGWDGYYQRKICDQGVYFYLITFKIEGGTKEYLYKGDLTLLR